MEDFEGLKSFIGRITAQDYDPSTLTANEIKKWVPRLDEALEYFFGNTSDKDSQRETN